ncbi:hypothetical protein LY15_003160 [Prauserella flava]|nr:hypothetical protein [Prauserella flava]MCR3734746.1 hypothetical protein [Prauserella salsuginis]
MRGCVLAGVWGAGKTSVYQRTLGRLAAAGCESLIAMPQAATITTHTYTPGAPHEHAAHILSWLDHLTAFLEETNRRFQASTLPKHRFASAWTPTCLLEGLGFDAPMYGLPFSRDALTSVEQRLAVLGVHLVLLRVPDDRIRAQCVESTRHYRGPKWARYLEGFGATDAGRAEHVRQVQAELTRWVQTSPLPLHVLDTTTQDWDVYSRYVAELIADQT